MVATHSRETIHRKASVDCKFIAATLKRFAKYKEILQGFILNTIILILQPEAEVL